MAETTSEKMGEGMSRNRKEAAATLAASWVDRNFPKIDRLAKGREVEPKAIVRAIMDNGLKELDKFTDLEANGVRYDATSHTITSDGRAVNLTPGEMAVVLLLLRRADRYTRVEEIMRQTGSSMSALYKKMSLIRKKMPGKIKNRRFYGYRITQ